MINKFADSKITSIALDGDDFAEKDSSMGNDQSCFAVRDFYESGINWITRSSCTRSTSRRRSVSLRIYCMSSMTSVSKACMSFSSHARVCLVNASLLREISLKLQM